MVDLADVVHLGGVRRPARQRGTGHGIVPFAAAGSTAQQAPTLGALAGGPVGIGSLRLIHQTAPTTTRPSSPTAASLVRQGRAMPTLHLPTSNTARPA
jgi:hypothetical protein